jgi:8-oxo-dGTP diphosphatase
MKKGVDFIGTTVTFFCHDGAGNVFMSKRNANCRDEHFRWDIGGGGIEFGQDAEATVRKEVREEYLTGVLATEFLGYRDVHRVHNGTPTHWISLDFKVLIDRAKAGNGEPHKFDEVAWFRLDALPDPVHSQLPAFLEKYGHLL